MAWEPIVVPKPFFCAKVPISLPKCQLSNNWHFFCLYYYAVALSLSTIIIQTKKHIYYAER